VRILVVEDEALIAEEIEDRLSRLGFQVVGLADTAAKAIHLTEQTRPGLVLMDIRLKGEPDGIAAAAAITERLNVPVVFLTAHADEPTLQRAKATGPFGYVLKPFHERDLVVAVEVAIHRHALEQQLRERTAELQRTVAQLQQALNEVKTLRGLIPICPQCKKIRNDTGYWEDLETYLRTHTEVQFSHGLCLDCYENALRDLEGAPPP
jgi:AmiR/NasT family two-component response regulator